MNFEFWQGVELPSLGVGATAGDLESWQNAELPQVGIGTLGVASGEIRLTSLISLVELAANPEVVVTSLVTLVELLDIQVQVTQLSVLVEMSAADMTVTQMAVLVEMVESVLSVTQLCVLVEMVESVLSVTQLCVLVEMAEAITSPMATYYKPNPAEQELTQLPEATVGYQLDAGNSYWSVVVPEATQNLLRNPSYEYPLQDPDFYQSINQISGFDSYEQTHVNATRGFFCLLCRPVALSEAFVAQTFFPAVATWYTFSFDLHAKAGSQYRVDVVLVASMSEGGVIRRVWIKKDRTSTERYSVTFFVPAAHITGATTRTVKVKLHSSSENSTNHWMYTDGWQVEQKPYATTYVDGSLIDDSIEADPNAYVWDGLPHHSTSRRSATVYNGGRIRSLFELGIKTVSIQGLGYTPPELDMRDLPGGGSYMAGLKDVGREFSIAAKMFGCDRKEIPQRKQTLIDWINHATRKSGQMVLRYQPVDRYGMFFGQPLNIPCVYQGGLEGNTVDHYSDQLELHFVSETGKIFEDFGQVDEIGLTQHLLTNSFSVRDPVTGEYEAPITSMTDFTGLQQIYCCTYALNGDLIVGGQFSQINGVPALNVARFREANQTWEALGYGLNLAVYALTVVTLSTGEEQIIAGGAFTEDGFGNVMRHIAVWWGAAWDEVGSGLNDDVYVITQNPRGDVYYIGGRFTADNAANSLDKFCAHTIYGSTGVFIGYTLNFDPAASVYDILVRRNGHAVMVGNFQDINGDPDYYLLAEFIPVDDLLWSGYGVGVEMETLYGVKEDRYGVLYICGKVIPIGGGDDGLKYWSGSSWISAVTNVQNQSGQFSVHSFDFDENNTLHAIVNYLYDLNLYQFTLELSGNIAIPPHLNIYTTSSGGLGDLEFYPKVKFFKENQKLTFCVGYLDFSIGIPHFQEITCRGTAPSACDFYMVNPAFHSVQQLERISNHSTDREVLFTEFNFYAGDIRYQLSARQPKMYVNRDRQSLENFILGGSSDNQFLLRPGSNHILVSSRLIEGPFDHAYLRYVPAHWSIDRAVSL